MDLSTRYLGLHLSNPFVPGASPLTSDLDMVRRLEDVGAAAVVLPSLFEEDIVRYEETADRYLEHLFRVKRQVSIPVIASLNGTTPDSWLRYAQLIEHAGAAALELNVYHVPTDLSEDSASVERRVVDIVAVLKESIAIPLAVKLSPFYSSLPHLAAELDRMGADGLVLFNRFYQAEIDPELKDTTWQLTLSSSHELALRLQWIAILAGRVKASLAVSGGVHDAIDAVKAVMAGADCVQLVSALLAHGAIQLHIIRREFVQWGEAHGYASLTEMRGVVSCERSADPSAFQRGNYVRLLQSPHKSAALIGQQGGR
jgi:dihydroorotate dehydrogenase (fumarate)